MYGGHISKFLDINNHVSLKPEVIAFMVNHPELSKPFNPVRAFNDVVQFCGKGADNEK